MVRYTRTTAELTADLVELERQIAHLRVQQAVIVNELDRGQARLTDASRTTAEYVQSHADVSTATARDLVLVGTTMGHHRTVNRDLAAGRITFDRAVVTLAHLASHASDEEMAQIADLNLEDARRRLASRKRLTLGDEHSLHARRHFTAQPSLDRTHYRLWGEVPGYEGALIEKAVVERADEFQRQSPDVATNRGQRQADALVAMAQDSLDRREEERGDPNPGGPTVTVFVDARETEPTETAAEVAFGPRVGPVTLESMLCSGSVRVVGLEGDQPVSSSASSRAIPPAVRDAVALRDGGCTIDGCRSRYRLQPHHITPWSHGGRHEMDNLTTVCWYHHHVAIHRSGYHIDPESPPRRRRLLRPDSSRGRIPRSHDPP